MNHGSYFYGTTTDQGAGASRGRRSFATREFVGGAEAFFFLPSPRKGCWCVSCGEMANRNVMDGSLVSRRPGAFG